MSVDFHCDVCVSVILTAEFVKTGSGCQTAGFDPKIGAKGRRPEAGTGVLGENGPFSVKNGEKAGVARGKVTAALSKVAVTLAEVTVTFPKATVTLAEVTATFSKATATLGEVTATFSKVVVTLCEAMAALAEVTAAFAKPAAAFSKGMAPFAETRTAVALPATGFASAAAGIDLSAKKFAGQGDSGEPGRSNEWTTDASGSIGQWEGA